MNYRSMLTFQHEIEILKVNKICLVKFSAFNRLNVIATDIYIKH